MCAAGVFVSGNFVNRNPDESAGTVRLELTSHLARIREFFGRRVGQAVPDSPAEKDCRVMFG